MYAALIFVAACSPNFKYFFHDNNYLWKLNTAYLCVCVVYVCVVMFVFMNTSHTKPYGSERASTRKVFFCNDVRFWHFHTVLNIFHVHKTISKVALFYKWGCVRLLIWNTRRVYLFWIFFFFLTLGRLSSLFLTNIFLHFCCMYQNCLL